MTYSVVSFKKPGEFAQLAVPLLLKNEPLNQIQLSMLNNLEGLLTPFEWMFGIYSKTELIGVATKTLGPKFKLLVSPLSLEAIEFLVSEIGVRFELNLVGVLSERNTAEKFSKNWAWLKKCEFENEMEMGVFQCTQVKIPDGISGFYRPAKIDEIETILEWRRDYMIETRLPEETPKEAHVATQKIIESRNLKVWESEGKIVSMANASPGTPNGGRISLVYTPPSLRGRNFASALVAHATQEFFDTGKKFGFLNTDLLNPVSNKIYERIGYKKVSEALSLKFSGGSSLPDD